MLKPVYAGQGNGRMVTELIEEGHIDSETPDVNKTTSLLGAPTTDAESALNNHDQGVGVTES